jgi:hypothetical protein
MIEMLAPLGVTSFSHDGVEHHVKDGSVHVEHHIAQVLRSHGFWPKDEPKPKPVLSAEDHVRSPREQFFDGLAALGVVGAENVPQDKLVDVFKEACDRQAERLAFEVKAAENRVLAELTKEDGKNGDGGKKKG